MCEASKTNMVFPPLLVVVLLGVVSVILLLKVLFRKQELPKNLPNGSMGLPFLGETLGFLKPHKTYTLGNYLPNHISKYGRVFKSNLFGSPTIVSCDHDLNMFILQNDEKLFEVSYPKPVYGVLGNLSLVVAVGDIQKRMRNTALVFTTACKSKPEFILDVNKRAVSLMAEWKNRKQVMLCEEVKKLSLNLMVKQVLSMEPDEPEAKQILEDFLKFMKGLVSLPLNIPGTAYDKAVKARINIHSTIRAIMKERIQGEIKKEDFCDVLLNHSSLKEEEKVSVMLDMLLGGYDTTSLLLALTVYFLGQSPMALERLKDEQKALRKRKGEEPLDWEDYKQMEFTQNVINEALRCGNIVKFLHRKTIKEVNYKGFVFPCGWKVLPVFASSHLDASVFKNPSEFNPWRWDDKEKAKNYGPFAFGKGLRQCPGAELAKVETAIFIHYFVLHFRWKPKEEDHPMAYPYVDFPKGLPIELEPLEEG